MLIKISERIGNPGRCAAPPHIFEGPLCFLDPELQLLPLFQLRPCEGPEQEQQEQQQQQAQKHQHQQDQQQQKEQHRHQGSKRQKLEVDF